MFFWHILERRVQYVDKKHRRAMYQRAVTMFYIYHTLKMCCLVKIDVILLEFCLAWPFCTKITNIPVGVTWSVWQFFSFLFFFLHFFMFLDTLNNFFLKILLHRHWPCTNNTKLLDQCKHTKGMIKNVYYYKKHFAITGNVQKRKRNLLLKI